MRELYLLHRLTFVAVVLMNAGATARIQGGNAVKRVVSSPPTLGALRHQVETSHWVSTIERGVEEDVRAAVDVQAPPARRLEALTLDTMMERARQSGKRARNAIQKLRGGSDELFENLVTAVKVNMCESDVSKTERFVSETDARAYKYDNGSCVRLINPTNYSTVYAYDHELCEVEPNCHWADFDPWMDDSRMTMYAKYETMTPEEAVAKIKNYSNSVFGFAVPGIVLSLASLISMFIFLCCCCRNKSCCCKPRVGGYNRLEKFLPVVICVLFNIGLCVCAVLAFFQREIALDGISDTFDGVNQTVHSASEWTFAISAPLESIRDTVVDATTNISLAISGLGEIGNDLNTFEGLLNTLATDVNASALPEGCNRENDLVCIECIVCSFVSNKVTATSAQIKTNADPAVEDLETVHGQIEVLLVDIATEVRDEVNEEVEMIRGIRDTLEKVQRQVDNTQGYFSDYKPSIAHTVRGVFAVAAIVGAIGLVGVAFAFSRFKRAARVMHVAYIFGFLVLFMSFLVSAVALALSILMGDTCEVVDSFSSNWTVPLGEYSGQIANACFHNESLIGALGLEDKLAFARGGIAFPDIDVDKSTNFSQMTTLSDSVSNMTGDGAFPVSGLLNSSIDVLNTLTGQTAGSCTPGGGTYVADETILTPWHATNDPPASSGFTFMVERYHPYDGVCSAVNADAEPFSCFGNECPFSLRIGQEYSNARGLYTVKAAAEAFVRRLQADVAALMSFSTAFVAKITDMVTAVYDVRDQLEASLIKDVDEFERVMYCRFVADGYADIFNALCGDVMPALTMLSLLLYLVAFLLVPVNVCLVILARRLLSRYSAEQEEGGGKKSGGSNEVGVKTGVVIGKEARQAPFDAISRTTS